MTYFNTLMVKSSKIYHSSIWCCLFLAVHLHGQGPFAFHKNVDGPFLALGLGTNIGGYALARQNKPFTADQLSPLPVFNGPAIDRTATRYWSSRAELTSNILFGASAILPAVVSLRSKQWGINATMGLEALMLTNGLTQLTKNSFRRTRPYVYNAAAPYDLKLESDARRSFISGHTSVSTTACFFGATLFQHYYPKSRLRPWVWAGAAVLPAGVGLARIRAGKHFPTDVLAGYAVGALCGWLVPKLHLR
jgi:membrane-associated phospholipid phosphatase